MKSSKNAGRPRAFDPDEALERAIEVFWRKGYEGTSLTDLTEAMGINRPSLYAAFGNKEALFRKAMDRYTCKASGFIPAAMEAPTARETVELLFRGTVDFLGTPACPNGCLSVGGALAKSEEAEPIRADLAARRFDFENSLKCRFERAIEAGELPPETDAAALAGYVATLHQGLSVQFSGGKSGEQLHRVVDLILAAWPPTV